MPNLETTGIEHIWSSLPEAIRLPDMQHICMLHFEIRYMQFFYILIWPVLLHLSPTSLAWLTCNEIQEYKSCRSAPLNTVRFAVQFSVRTAHLTYCVYLFIFYWNYFHKCFQNIFNQIPVLWSYEDYAPENAFSST